jgi:hypothetical protein
LRQSPNDGCRFGCRSDSDSAPETTPIDPGLARLMEAWPTLAEPLKAAVLALVESAASNK